MRELENPDMHLSNCAMVPAAAFSLSVSVSLSLSFSTVDKPSAAERAEESIASTKSYKSGSMATAAAWDHIITRCDASTALSNTTQTTY